MSNRVKSLLENTATLAIVVTCGVMVWTTVSGRPLARAAERPAPTAKAARPEPELPTRAVAFEGVGVKGSAAATVVLVAYSDFQCPFCSRFAKDTMPQVVTEYVNTGKVQFVFRHLPLRSIHPAAEAAGAGAECAGDQGRFWEMHDSLFENPRELTEVSIQEKAKVLGLDEKAFKACVAGQGRERVQRDAKEAEGFQVASTPTFFIGLKRSNGTTKIVERLSGAKPFSAFKASLDKWLVNAGATQ